MAWTPPVIPLTETASSVWPTRPFGDAGGVHFIIQAEAASFHQAHGRSSLPCAWLHYAARLNSATVLKHAAHASAKPSFRSSSRRLALTRPSSFRLHA